MPDTWVTSTEFFDGVSDYEECPECWDAGDCFSDCSSWCQIGGPFVQLWEGSDLWLPGYVDPAAKSFIAPYGTAFVPYGRVRLTENLETWKYVWYAFDTMTPLTIPVATTFQLISDQTGPDVDIDNDPVEMELSGRIIID